MSGCGPCFSTELPLHGLKAATCTMLCCSGLPLAGQRYFRWLCFWPEQTRKVAIFVYPW